MINSTQTTDLVKAYSEGLVTWHEIDQQTGASYGELLIALGLRNLSIPKVTATRSPAQDAFFNRVLDDAAATARIRP
jgi:uncharacterized protein